MSELTENNRLLQFAYRSHINRIKCSLVPLLTEIFICTSSKGEIVASTASDRMRAIAKFARPSPPPADFCRIYSRPACVIEYHSFRARRCRNKWCVNNLIFSLNGHLQFYKHRWCPVNPFQQNFNTSNGIKGFGPVNGKTKRDVRSDALSMEEDVRWFLRDARTAQREFSER